MVGDRKKDFRYLFLFLIAIAVVNLLSSYVFTRFDFTKEKRFTLSPITKSLLKNTSGKVEAVVYLEGDFPGGFKRLRNATRDILSEFAAYSNGNFRFVFVNPLTGSQESREQTFQQLAEKGIEPTNLSVKTEEGLSQKMIFPAALITYRGKQIPVKLLQNKSGATPEEVLNNSIQNLEYAFTSTIKKVVSGGKPRVGFTEGNGELTDLQLSDAMKSLQDGFEVGRVDLSTIDFAGLDKLKLLIVSKPTTEFSEQEKYKIDYLVMKGGRVLWAVDNVSAELDSLRGAASQLTFPKKLNLDDMLFKYGARINYNLIADMNCAQISLSVGNVAGQSQIQPVPWLFYPVFVPVSQHPLIKNLDGIRSEFASTVDTVAAKGIKKTIILSSSPYSKALNAPVEISLQMVEQEPNPKEFLSRPKPVAVLLEGSFSSVFRNRPLPANLSIASALPEKSMPTKMIVIGDGDVFKNQVGAKDNSPFPLGFDRYTGQQYGNKSFLLNAVDYLTDDAGIISLRNKEVKLRLLDRVKIKEEKSFWQALNLVLPLVMLIVFGIFQHYFRRQKFAR